MQTVEELLRTSQVTNGVISLVRLSGGSWRATVAHHAGQRFTDFSKSWKDDPVEALRIALLEDERLHRDLERRYREAPRIAEPEPAPIAGALPVLDEDFEDWLG